MSLSKKVIIGIIVVILLIILVQIVNAAKYKMIVNVVEGENVMGINPSGDRLDFGDLSRNNGMTRYVTLKSEGNMATYIAVLKFGGISDLVKIDDSRFVLKGGEEKRIGFEIQIPPSAEIKKYSGWTIIFRVPKLF